MRRVRGTKWKLKVGNLCNELGNIGCLNTVLHMYCTGTIRKQTGQKRGRKVAELKAGEPADSGGSIIVVHTSKAPPIATY